MNPFDDAYFIVDNAHEFAFIPMKMLASLHISKGEDGFWDVIFTTVSGREYKVPEFNSFDIAKSFCESQMEEISRYNEACSGHIHSQKQE